MISRIIHKSKLVLELDGLRIDVSERVLEPLAVAFVFSLLVIAQEVADRLYQIEFIVKRVVSHLVPQKQMGAAV